MEPGNLSSNLLDKCFVRPSVRKGAHIKQVGTRKAFHIWKCAAQVGGETLDHFRAPSLLLLTGQNVAPDAPIQKHEFPIYREGRFDLGRLNALL